MAKGKKTGGRNFVPGHSVRRPRLSDTELYVMIREHKEDIIRFYTKYSAMTIEQLKRAALDETKTAHEHLIIRTLMISIQNGDPHRLDPLLSRVVGKPREVVERTEESLSSEIVLRAELGNASERPDND